MEWDGKAKHWLLTAFEKRDVGGGTRMDTTANGVGDDTARPKPDALSLPQQTSESNRVPLEDTNPDFTKDIVDANAGTVELTERRKGLLGE